MTGRLMNYNGLLATEQSTNAITESRLAGITDNFPCIWDALSHLAYYCGKSPDTDTPDGVFHSWCRAHYVRITYSFRSAYLLCFLGYYLESVIVLRHIIEVFAQIRYFDKHRSELEDHWKRTKIVRFKAIFDSLSPGYYEKFYGRQLSSLAHGGLGTSMFRFECYSPTESRTVMGSEYNEMLATYILIQIIAMLYGFLSYFPKFFPQFDLIADSDTKDARQDAMQWLEKCMNSHKTEYPKSHAWFQHIDKIIK